MPYHALFGVKLLAAICVLFLASALVGRSEAFAAWRAKPAKWLTLSVVLALVVVLISGLGTPPQSADTMRRVGITEVLAKPFGLEELGAVIAGVLEGKRSG